MGKQFVGPSIRKAAASLKFQMGVALRVCTAASSAIRAITVSSPAAPADYRQSRTE